MSDKMSPIFLMSLFFLVVEYAIHRLWLLFYKVWEKDFINGGVCLVIFAIGYASYTYGKL